jgi:hypothetical protein
MDKKNLFTKNKRLMRYKHEIKLCERCNTPFECKLGDITNCQCSSIAPSEATRQFLEQTDFDCLCKNCLTAINEKWATLATYSFPQPDELKEGFHYYIDKNLYVFTENYHLLRGYCCRNGCRHCPYGFNKE